MGYECKEIMHLHITYTLIIYFEGKLCNGNSKQHL